MEYRPGMLAKSLAGHDKNQVYVIIQEDDQYVFLCDGKNRTLERLKKKKKKHVQLIKTVPESLAEKLASESLIHESVNHENIYRKTIYNEDIRKAIGGNTDV